MIEDNVNTQNVLLLVNCRASPMLQLPAGNNAVPAVQQQIFLQPTVTGTPVQQQVRGAQPQTALQTVQMSTASTPTPSNVLNLGQVSH